MKTKEEIQERIEQLEKNLQEYQEMYENLDQISMQRPNGRYLIVQINTIKGEINGLRWVIDEQ